MKAIISNELSFDSHNLGMLKIHQQSSEVSLCQNEFIFVEGDGDVNKSAKVYLKDTSSSKKSRKIIGLFITVSRALLAMEMMYSFLPYYIQYIQSFI